MRKMLLSLVAGALLSGSAFAFVQPTASYETRAQFEASGDGPICQLATDGCSEFMMNENGTVGEAVKACKVSADFNFQRSCAVYKDNIMFMDGGTVDSAVAIRKGLSELAYHEYLNIQAKIASTTLRRVRRFLIKYTDLLRPFTITTRKEIHARALVIVNNKIAEFEANFPEEGKLDADFRAKYLLRVYLKLELLRYGREHHLQ